MSTLTEIWKNKEDAYWEEYHFWTNVYPKIRNDFATSIGFSVIGNITRAYSVDGLSGLHGGLTKGIAVHEACGTAVGLRVAWMNKHLGLCPASQ